MLKHLICATPTYKGQLGFEHRTMTDNLRMLCAFTMQAEMQRKFSDRLLVPSARKYAFNYVGWMDISSCSIARNRNRFLFNALRLTLTPRGQNGTAGAPTPADYLLMVDADTSSDNAKAILQMLTACDGEGAAVISAPVLRRDGRYNQIVEHDGKMLYADPAKFMGKVVPVRRAGGAFMALNLAWFREHWGTWDPEDPWFHMKPATEPSGEPTDLAEDYVLCDGIAKRGGKLLLDARLEPYHDGAPYPPQHPYSRHGRVLEVEGRDETAEDVTPAQAAEG